MNESDRVEEKHLQEYLKLHPESLESGLTNLELEFSLNPKKWLNSEDKSNLPWDNYSQGYKKVDILSVNQNGNLVICELKIAGGGGDEAVLQAYEYYHMLINDEEAKEKANKLLSGKNKATIRESDFCKTEIYIVVCGYISCLMKKRIEIVNPHNNVRFKVFQAIPPRITKTDWKITGLIQ